MHPLGYVNLNQEYYVEVDVKITSSSSNGLHTVLNLGPGTGDYLPYIDFGNVGSSVRGILFDYRQPGADSSHGNSLYYYYDTKRTFTPNQVYTVTGYFTKDSIFYAVTSSNEKTALVDIYGGDCFMFTAVSTSQCYLSDTVTPLSINSRPRLRWQRGWAVLDQDLLFDLHEEH